MCNHKCYITWKIMRADCRLSITLQNHSGIPNTGGNGKVRFFE
jgi:hypothetical protein